MVIRSNRDLYEMKKGITTIIFHCSEFPTNGEPDDEKKAPFCPRDKKYQKNKVFGELVKYKSKINIPETTMILFNLYFHTKIFRK